MVNMPRKVQNVSSLVQEPAAPPFKGNKTQSYLLILFLSPTLQGEGTALPPVLHKF